MLAKTLRALLAAAALLALPAFAGNPMVRMTTNVGMVEIELFQDKAPATVKNFMAYVDAGFYNGTLFHRVIPDFMIQGGGFAPGLQEKPTRPPVQNEADNGLKNTVGTLAMARTMDPHSASAQFFINVNNNGFLDHTRKTMNGWGYAVFGRVVKGLEVVGRIAEVATRSVGPFDDVPRVDVVIVKMERLPEPTKKK
ncbi:MAG: peptidyl-prolyl cis-trans isomerase [Hydrogenophilaceae bacterium]|nr:peptidyl-prolyl cis-trans isomerase [Hydrogenophilaceae bacterium]